MFTNARRKNEDSRGDDQVAGERERAADPGGGAVDRGEHRLAHLAHGEDRRVVELAEPHAEIGRTVGVGAMLAQVGAGGERPPGAGDHHRANGVVGGAGGERVAQVLAELLVPRVQRLGAVERERCGAVGDLERYGGIGHGRSLCGGTKPGRAGWGSVAPEIAESHLCTR